MKKITIIDVAKKVRISPTTVSLILNNKWKEYGIKEDTYKKVLKVLEKLDYRPNILAKGLKSGKTTLVGLILGDITNGMEVIFKGIQSYFLQKEYELILKVLDLKSEGLINGIKYVLEKKVEGIIMDNFLLQRKETRKYIKKLEKMGIKIVFIGDKIKNFTSPFVGNDNEKVGYIATKHLISHGHREILCVTNTYYNNLIGILRVKGYKKALKESGINIKKELIVNFYPDKYGYFGGGYRVINEILKENERNFTAIFAHGDPVAIGIIKAIDEFGLKIPDDIAIVSVDDVEFAKYTIPPLTTVHLDNFKIGLHAADALYRLLNNKDVKSHFFKPKLIVRSSCGCHFKES